ncbi:D-alanyl-D-alanine carboxypeptidase family protein [Bifidobacterium vespertilionis]|uniref:D-alanyl-D-alanine carboxypeptidase family protein n=2 Tax=Bifidobacterium vespertilionis TaxID=2562524 RepID=A0A5J5E0Z1_9BIFI|nr:D-alanyl-D-alanine carboxypeptidase family protein [Bifidobacterium vespertilionis]KAA8824181.1 D-alanyl-D-alanine carboxypeptidase family protein [Bifidobacterium vespertilionis]
MTGSCGGHAAQSFAVFRMRRAWTAMIRRAAVLIVCVAAVALAASCAGRFMHWTPFARERTAAAYDPARWNLIVVNRWHAIPSEYPQTELTTLRNGQQVDARIYPDLQRMFDAMRADGLDPEVTAGFRTRDVQQRLMDEKVAEYRGKGLPDAAARVQAEQWVAIPGTSEHEIGLAVDVNARGRATDANWAVYRWLAANAYRYGLILRCPDGGSAMTGNGYEPWHYRYVGADAAKAMFASG